VSDSTEPLEQQILADAEKRAEPVKRRAQRQAEDVLRRAEQDAEKQARQVIERAREKAEVEANRLRARTELQAENIKRAAGEEILDEVRARAVQRLGELVSSDRYPDVLVQLASSALEAMDGRHFELVMRAEDRDAHGERVARALRDHAARMLRRQVIVKVAADAISASGGLVVRTDDERQVCDQTFEARLDRLWEQLREEVGKGLFAPQAEGA